MNFPLLLSLIISAFFYVVVERFVLSFDFIFFAAALVENAYAIKTSTSTSEVVSSERRDFRFSYASLNSKYVYAVSLIIAYISLKYLQPYLGGYVAVVSFLVYAFLFVVLRLASSELLSYFEKATVVKTKDYKAVYEARTVSEICKADIIASISKCQLKPGLSEDLVGLLEVLSETIKFSSLVSQSSLFSISDIVCKIESGEIDEFAAIKQIRSVMNSV